MWNFLEGKASVPCNGTQLRMLRRRRGWTQATLAVESGYSERLIRKAEAGAPLQANTIEDLAESLSTSREPVYPESLVHVPQAIVLQVLAAIEHQLPKILQELLASDLQVWIAGDPEVIPFAGAWDKRRGLLQLERLWRACEVRNSAAMEVLVDDSCVIVSGDYHLRAKATGDEFLLWVVQQHVIDGGQIARSRIYYDTSVVSRLLDSRSVVF